MSVEQKVCTEHVQYGHGGEDCDICYHRWFFKTYSAPAIRKYLASIRRKPKAEQ